jgi:hypothetical protein
MKLKLLGFGIVGIFGVSGLVWLVNLPYPMIRRPVAKVAPILLLPSYLTMDRNYRAAIANVEQADQLIIQATSAADIALGAEKTKLAQENLNALPVWFLGYEPQRYCTFMQCSWQFTIDEFEAARAKIGRMEAIVFQEQNALNTLTNAETSISKAKEQYSKETDLVNKQNVINQWQKSLDDLTQIPPQTFAGKQAEGKLIGYKRDFEEIAGTVLATQETNTMISVAQQYALQAVKMCEKPPYKVNIWQKCEEFWENAINKLENIANDNVGYQQAQTLMAQYQGNLANIEIAKEKEEKSSKYLILAQEKTDSLIANTPSNSQDLNVNRTKAELQSIINDLKQVESGTTAYSEAQELRKNAENKFKELP